MSGATTHSKTGGGSGGGGESTTSKKRGRRKGSPAEEEEEKIPNPFDVHGGSWEKRRVFLSQLQSRRTFRTGVLPTKPLASRTKRSPSLPAVLFTENPELQSREYGKDTFSIVRRQPAPHVRHRRRLSTVVSQSEVTAVDLSSFLEGPAAQEGEDEKGMQNKLDFWGGGHERYELDLSSKSLMNDDFYFLAHALRFNFLLRSLDLSKCFVTDLDVELLCSSMEMNICVEELNLRQTKVGDAGARSILHLCRLNDTLTALDCRQTTMTSAGGTALLEATRVNPNLTMLNGFDLPALRAAPPKAGEFSGRGFGAPDVVILRDLFGGSAVVRFLDLSKNRLGPKSAPALVDLVKSLPALAALNLAKNRIGSQGTLALASLLASDSRLRSLDISANGVMLRLPEKALDPTGVEALAQVLAPGTNSTLSKLDHNENDIPEDLGRWIDERVMVNRALTFTKDSFSHFLEGLVPTLELESQRDVSELNLQCDYSYLAMEKLRLDPAKAIGVSAHEDSYVIHPSSRKGEGQSAETPRTKHRLPRYELDVPVMCRWRVDGRLYPGNVIAKNSDGTFNVRFNDGGLATSVQRTELRQGHRDKLSRWDP